MFHWVIQERRKEIVMRYSDLLIVILVANTPVSNGNCDCDYNRDFNLKKKRKRRDYTLHKSINSHSLSADWKGVDANHYRRILIDHTTGSSPSVVFATRAILNPSLQQTWARYFLNGYVINYQINPYSLQFLCSAQFQCPDNVCPWCQTILFTWDWTCCQRVILDTTHFTTVTRI